MKASFEKIIIFDNWVTGFTFWLSDNFFFFSFSVRALENGVVGHIGTFEGDHVFSVGDVVTIEVESERRRLNARLHSAGHLLGFRAAKFGKG